jgi:hypothetical protein
VQFLSRALEHAVASSSEHSLFIVEPLIELANALISAGPALSSSSSQVHIHLILYALSLLAPCAPAPQSPTLANNSLDASGNIANAVTSAHRKAIADAFLPTSPTSTDDNGDSMPTGQEGHIMPAAKRLALRSRAMRVLASALHHCNRVSDPLRICMHALAMQMLALRSATHVATLETRATVCALSVAKLFMLSEQGMEALSQIADCPAAPEGMWRTVFGRGRPGHGQIYFTPVVPHDSLKERRHLLVRSLLLVCVSSFCRPERHV